MQVWVDKQMEFESDRIMSGIVGNEELEAGRFQKEIVVLVDDTTSFVEL